MKEVVSSLYFSARNNLTEMKVSEMSLSERVLFERALAQLDAMKRILDKYNLQA